jgi:hypothetical protein
MVCVSAGETPQTENALVAGIGLLEISQIRTGIAGAKGLMKHNRQWENDYEQHRDCSNSESPGSHPRSPRRTGLAHQWRAVLVFRGPGRRKDSLPKPASSPSPPAPDRIRRWLRGLLRPVFVRPIRPPMNTFAFLGATLLGQSPCYYLP